MSRVYAYLRASTDEQDATRAINALEKFVADRGLTIQAKFIENKSGASLERPELLRLIEYAAPGDLLLVEQIDRLTRLNGDEWDKLHGIIKAKGLRIVSLDMESSYAIAQASNDDFTNRLLMALNEMLLHFLAATAKKDYDDRRRRMFEGIERAKERGAYTGRKPTPGLHENIIQLYEKKINQSEIARILKVSRHTVMRVIRAYRFKQEAKDNE